MAFRSDLLALLSSLDKGEKVITGMSCSHMFHFECCMQWLEKGNEHCPYCREDMMTPEAMFEAAREELGDKRVEKLKNVNEEAARRIAQHQEWLREQGFRSGENQRPALLGGPQQANNTEIAREDAGDDGSQREVAAGANQSGDVQEARAMSEVASEEMECQDGANQAGAVEEARAMSDVASETVECLESEDGEDPEEVASVKYAVVEASIDTNAESSTDNADDTGLVATPTDATADDISTPVEPAASSDEVSTGSGEAEGEDSDCENQKMSVGAEEDEEEGVESRPDDTSADPDITKGPVPEDERESDKSE